MLKPKRPATAGAYIRSVSPSTRAQNERARGAETSMAAFTSAREKLNNTTADAPLFSQLKIASFQEELQAFEGTLTQMGKKIRLEDGSIMDARTRKRLEEKNRELEKQRREEEEERRLRTEAKEAQNPRRRVALRMEQQRLMSDPKLAARVPMRNMPVPGGDVDEKPVPVVDVLKLQQMSLGLNLGNKTFHGIYSLALQRDKEQAWEEYALGPMESRKNLVKANAESGGDSMVSRTRKVMHEKMMQRALKREEREVSAKLKQRQLIEQKILATVQSCKNGLDPKQEALLPPAVLKAFRASSAPQLEIEPDEDEIDEDDDLVMESVPQTPKTGASSPTGSRLPSRKPSVSTSFSKPRSLSKISGSTSLPSPSHGAIALAQRPFSRWGVVKGALAWIWLLRRIRESHRAADCLRQFLEMAEQVCMMKSRAKLLTRQIVKVQGVCRSFLSRKGQWINENTPMWIQIEDNHLAKYKVQYDTQAQVAARKLMAADPQATWASVQPIPLKWQELRIPLKNRRFALGRFYTRTLRKRVQAGTLWADVIGVCLDEKKDLQEFWRKCGFESPEPATPADDNQVEEGSSSSKTTKEEEVRVKLTEQTILDLIAEQALDLRGIGAFNKHPACTAKQKASPGRNVSKSAAASDFNLAAMKRRSVLQKAAETPLPDPNDLEEVFKRFTPRLRKIREAPGAVEGIDVDVNEEALPRDDALPTM